MPILVVGSSKGGCGKSTLCTNLTIQQLQSEPDTLLVDSDPQKSASNWNEVRESKDWLSPALVMEKTGGELSRSVVKMAEKYPYIYIDVPGNNSPELRSSLVIADLLIMPLRPCNFDAWVFARDMELVSNTRHTNPELKVLVVFNGLSTNPAARRREIADLQDYLSEYEHIRIADSFICHRSSFNKAVAQGASVTEIKSEGDSSERAKQEIGALFTEIQAYIREGVSA